MTAPGRAYLLLTVFTAGLTTLAVELSASRLLGNIFGTSNLVWANVIGLMLLYLSAGYFIGGRWADRSPRPATFYGLLVVAAALAGLVPLAARPVLRFAAEAMATLDAAVAGGSFLAVLILFSAPVTLLGCASPFAIRLAMGETSQAGQVAGRIYAISTLGSLVGTFSPVLVFIPWIGTARTFLVFAGLLFAVAWAGLLAADRRRALWALLLPAVVAAAAWFSLSGSLRPVDGLIPQSEIESEYNFIQVVQRGDTRYLLLNEGQGIHSVYAPDRVETFGTWDYFLAAPYFNDPPGAVTSLAVVGLAAGTIPRQFTAVYGPIPIDGFEIDGAIVDVGRRYFDMNEPNLSVHVEDGRWGLAHSGRRYSVIAVDAYRLPYIPWHLTTQEFFQEARSHLADDGVLVINVGRTLTDRRLIDAMAGTLRAVFPSVHAVDVPDTFNTILYATARPTRVAALVANRDRLAGQGAAAAVHPLLRSTLDRAVQNLRPEPPGSMVFTDDWAPIEQLTNALVIDFFLGDQLRDLAH